MIKSRLLRTLINTGVVKIFTRVVQVTEGRWATTLFQY